MNISIFEIGSVCLVSRACIAEVGHEVVCIDVDAQKIKKLEAGIISI